MADNPGDAVSIQAALTISFELIYKIHLTSPKNQQQIRIKINTTQNK